MSKPANLTLLASLGVFSALTALPVTAQADTIHVPGDYPTIQEAIDVAVDGDEVVVCPGGYNEVINFLGKAITLRSTDGPDVTIIDGTGLNDSVVTCLSAEGPDTVLRGFTVTGGTGNSSVFGYTVGGGMINLGSSPVVADCIFSMNSADQDGGGMWNGDDANPIVLNCTFTGNNSGNRGGGIHNANSGSTLVNCTFDYNSAWNDGGGVADSSSSTTMVNCLFVENNATGHPDSKGGGVVCASTNFVAVNCTFWANMTSDRGGGGGLFRYEGTVAVSNSIFWANIPDQVRAEVELPPVSYSDVQGGLPGEGNIDVDPLFVDPDSGDFHLSPGSPCIDAGNNDAVPPEITTDLDGNPRFVDDPATEDTGQGTPPIVDMGAYEFQVDIPGDLNGDGCVDQRDLGILLAYYGWGDGGDIDGDEDTDQSDLGILLAHWGEGCP